MNRDFRDTKDRIRKFMQNHYSDTHLAQLLDHARSGQLSHFSCCCFAGIVTAQHADGKLHGRGMDYDHSPAGPVYDGMASIAFNQLANRGVFFLSLRAA